MTDSSTGGSVPGLRGSIDADPAGYTGTATLALTIEAVAPPAFTASMTDAAEIAYAAETPASTMIDVATLGAVTGAPTAYHLGSTGTATEGVSTNGATLTVSAAGVVTYRPVAGFYGRDGFTVRAVNAGGESSPAQVGVTVASPVFAASVAEPAGTVGVPYSQAVILTGGKAPYARFGATGLPPGLTISADGVISGIRPRQAPSRPPSRPPTIPPPAAWPRRPRRPRPASRERRRSRSPSDFPARRSSRPWRRRPAPRRAERSSR